MCSHELPIQCIWQKAHCYFKGALPAIWVVLSLFQEAFCSDLVFSRELCFFETSTCSHRFFKSIELIRNFSCSHPFDKEQNKRANAATHSDLLVFAEQELQQGDIIVSNNDNSLVSGMYILKEVIWQHQLQPPIFSMVVSIFHGSTWSNPYVNGTAFISL